MNEVSTRNTTRCQRGIQATHVLADIESLPFIASNLTPDKSPRYFLDIDFVARTDKVTLRMTFRSP